MIEQILTTGGDISSIAVLAILIKNYIDIRTMKAQVKLLWDHIFKNKQGDQKHVV